jgi:hypothetical protein
VLQYVRKVVFFVEVRHTRNWVEYIGTQPKGIIETRCCFELLYVFLVSVKERLIAEHRKYHFKYHVWGRPGALIEEWTQAWIDGQIVV